MRLLSLLIWINRMVLISDPLLNTHSLLSNQGDKRQSLVVEQEKIPRSHVCFRRPLVKLQQLRYLSVTSLKMEFLLENGDLTRYLLMTNGQ